MALLSLSLQDNPATLPREPRRTSAPLRLSFTIVDRALLPGRGILCSVLTHALALCAILFAPIYSGVFATAQPTELAAADISENRQVIYLPKLGGGSEGNGYRGGGSIIRRQGTSTSPARSSQGVSYPGPQAIVSDPPQPTNKFQTILRPALKNPPVLKSFVPAPNIVQTANAGPFPLLDARKPALPLEALKPNAPTQTTKTSEIAPPVIPVAPKTVEAPQLTVPDAPQRPVVPVAPIQAPKAPLLRAEGSAEPLRPDQFSPIPTRGEDLQNLLSLSPAPAAPAPSQGLPEGESRGRFAISPDADLNSSPAGLGAKTQASASSTAAVGDRPGTAPGDAATDGPSGTSNGSARLAAGSSGGIGTGSGKENGAGNGGNGTDVGRGSGTGTGVGTGAGSNVGTGSGGGAGPGGGSFQGMTIQGGTLEPGSVAQSRPHGLTAPQASYGMTIVSTASSGGGLPDFGVFFREQVYTVYIDMRRTVEDPAPSWTLQCALLPTQAAPQPNVINLSSQPSGGLVPPFPVERDVPKLPVEIVRKYLSKMVVVYAVIDTEGKFQQIVVKQSPDSQLNKPLLESLAKWRFRAAESNGQPVPVKILLGIPLAIPE